MEKNTLTVKITWALYLCFALYIFLTFLNLCYIPVAWIDEIYDLDPAVQFLKTGNLSSRIWHNEGTEKFLFCYLPLMFFAEIISLSVFPWEMLYVRLPFVLFFFAGMYSSFRLMKDVLKFNTLLSLAIVFLFINDKGTSEALRSVRVEPIELFFIPFLLWRILSGKDYKLSCLFVSFLFLSHPKSWAYAAVFLLYIFCVQNHRKQIFLSLSIFMLPVVAFLAFGKFDFQEILSQLFLHAGEHDVDAETSKFYNHFIVRFWPFYNVQPYVPVIYYISLIVSLRNIFLEKNPGTTMIEILFIFCNVYWFFTLQGFSRYNPVILLLSYIIAGKQVNSWLKGISVSPKMISAALVFMPVVCFPFMSRHAAAIIQREERKIDSILNWYGQIWKETTGPVLLIGEPSAYYYCLNKSGFDFSTFYSVRKFHYSAYKHIYVLSVTPFSHPELSLSAEYRPRQVSLLKESGKSPLTYYGTKVYKIKSEEAFEYIKLLYAP